MLLESGRISELVLLITLISVTYISIRQSLTGKTREIRKLAGIDAMTEAIGRSTELGRPLMMILRGNLDSDEGGPNAMAAYGVLGFIARQAAKHDLPLRIATDQGSHIPLITASLEEAYRLEERPDRIPTIPESIWYLSSHTLAFAGGAIALLEEFKPGANFIMGYVEGDALILAESGVKIGAMQVAGTGVMGQVPFLAIVCDYTLIGEEFFAAGAYLAQDKYRIGALGGQDYQKMIILALYILAFVAISIGSKWLVNLLSM